MRAEGGLKVTDDTIAEVKKMSTAEKRGFVLSLDWNHWKAFVNPDGTLDQEKLLAANYTAEQIPWILSEMQEIGWLAKPKAKKGRKDAGDQTGA